MKTKQETNEIKKAMKRISGLRRQIEKCEKRIEEKKDEKKSVIMWKNIKKGYERKLQEAEEWEAEESLKEWNKNWDELDELQLNEELRELVTNKEKLIRVVEGDFYFHVVKNRTIVSSFMKELDNLENCELIEDINGLALDKVLNLPNINVSKILPIELSPREAEEIDVSWIDDLYMRENIKAMPAYRKDKIKRLIHCGIIKILQKGNVKKQVEEIWKEEGGHGLTIQEEMLSQQICGWKAARYGGGNFLDAAGATKKEMDNIFRKEPHLQVDSDLMELYEELKDGKNGK